MPAMSRPLDKPKTRFPTDVGEEEIRLRAYEIYLERGALPGRDAEDWEQAKRELLSFRARP